MLGGRWIWWLGLLAIGVHSENPEEKVIRTPQGSVRGYKEAGDIFAFYGIPYATVPKGAYKFMPSYPPSTWLMTFDAVDKGIMCPQAKIEGYLENRETMQEDCLITNVFVPVTEEKKLPVVVYVHGGGYQFGFSNWVTPKNLVRSKKVIAITFNYRLGAHGFLCLGTKDVPGNAGLKDQLLLLRWVQKNIESYGGNPDDVTIAGSSAGASSVDLLMLSPAARGLFHKVIPESGSNLAPFSIQSDPLENAKRFASSKGFKNVDDIYALENFFKTASFDVLTSDVFLNSTDFALQFSPCIERSTGNQPILTDSPYNILKNNKYRKVPLLYGFSDMEGLYRAAVFDEWKDMMNKNFADFLPADLKFDSEDEKEEVIRKIKQYYFDGQPITDDHIVSFVNYTSDLTFTFPTLRAVRLLAEGGHDKIYLYEYNYAPVSLPEVPERFREKLKGATHCSQTIAVLDGGPLITSDPLETKLSEEYLKVKTVMRDIWLSFIRTGYPVPSGSSIPEWPSANADGSPHMALGSTVELRGALHQDRVRFWNDIYEKHYRQPSPPPSPPHIEL